MLGTWELHVELCEAVHDLIDRVVFEGSSKVELPLVAGPWDRLQSVGREDMEEVSEEVTLGGVGDGRARILCATKWLAKQRGSAQYVKVNMSRSLNMARTR